MRPINSTSDSFMGLGMSVQEMPRVVGQESLRAKSARVDMLSLTRLCSRHFYRWTSGHYLHVIDEDITVKREQDLPEVTLQVQSKAWMRTRFPASHATAPSLIALDL